ncbi:hypothetical protein C8F04DRAFT_1174023 [Mycena alexandri]|uniref:Uncharacterized protein n=1 Tax=Mycena alexandri TaxID=1745969 RepID=A0AAD6TG14_9AGAR|nr:hypothetical protein C8F04DRAFT_1174023 [Mycena alexandri]
MADPTSGPFLDSNQDLLSKPLRAQQPHMKISLRARQRVSSVRLNRPDGGPCTFEHAESVRKALSAHRFWVLDRIIRPTLPRPTTMVSKKKHCYCRPTCGELLSKRGRQLHYKQGNPLLRSKLISPPRRRTADNTFMEVDEVSDKDDDVQDTPLLYMSSPIRGSFTGEEIGEDDDSVMSDPESEFEPDENDEWNVFDEDKDRIDVVSREEMMRELDEMIAPDEDAESWDVGSELEETLG